MTKKEFHELKSYLSMRQAAEELGFSKEGIRKLILSEELAPVSQVDGFHLIHIEAIKEFKKKRKEQKTRDKRFKEI